MNTRKKAKAKWAQVGLMALVLTIGAGGMSAASAEETGNTTGQATVPTYETAQPAVISSSMVIGHASAGPGLLVNPIHQRNYWKLLVAAYAPELSEQWANALEDRKKLDDSVPKNAPTLHFSSKSESFTLPSVSAVPGAIGAVSVKEGALLKVEALEGTFESLGNVTTLPALSVNAIMSRELPPELQIYIDLNKAVEADDADSIRELLPQLLENYVKETENLKQNLEAVSPLVEDNADTK
ncbi:MAG: hypothetical protein K0R67_3840 [Paenibacillus sp.]|nr:hypothetical protein [Paenibacillus sp.]